jgi:hypothetical protein
MCVIPIWCDESDPTAIASALSCSVAEFPYTYLGLPISDKKLRKGDLMPWVERIGDNLPSWKANLMNIAGRATYVRFVLSALPIHVLIEPVFRNNGVLSDISRVRAWTVVRVNLDSHSVDARTLSNFSKVGFCILFSQVYCLPDITNSL